MTNEATAQKPVMIVGAGISAGLAALDLANSGRQVLLVVKIPSLEQLETEINENIQLTDCATCILAPKLLHLDEHPNIQLVSVDEVSILNGDPGNFQVAVKKINPIDIEEKLKSKLECFKQCPINSTDIEEFKRIYKSNRPSSFVTLNFPRLPDFTLKLLIERRKIPPCENACPAHVNSQEYIDLISKGQYLKSLNLIRDRCSLPSAIGRICPHPCEDVCNRAELDDAINICGLKRFVADYVNTKLEEKIEFLEEKKEKKVAIIGSGPAGLTVAYQLARRGYSITIFEKEPVAGGMLRLGVPNYRLPPEILNRDIEFIKSLGVEIKTNTPVGASGTTLQDLQQNYDAIFIAVGLPKSRKLNIEGEELENVIYGIDFLKSCSLGEKVHIGKNVIVIGGGDVAVDVARTALRKGAEKVQMVMLESEDIIPAHSWEIEEAKEEGILLKTSCGPSTILGKDGKVTGLEILYCSSVFDDDGRFNPVLDEDTEDIVQGDMIIVTIGQTADLTFLESTLEVERGIKINQTTFETSVPGIFAGGEIVTGPGSAIEAISTGNKAAIVIEKYLKGEDMSTIKSTIPDYSEDEIVTIDDLEELNTVIKAPRKNIELIDPIQRIKTFEDITLSITEEEALAEADRCLSCGICSECFECVKSCVAEIGDNGATDETESISVEHILLAPGDAWLSCFDLRLGTPYRWKIIRPVAMIDENLCMACRTCEWNCPFNGVEVQSTESGKKAKIIESACRGCGVCWSSCPQQAITIVPLTKSFFLQEFQSEPEESMEKNA